MRSWNAGFILILNLIFGIASIVISSPSDSLQVKIINTREAVGSFRFIERDSSNIILRVMDQDGNALKELLSNQVEISRAHRNAKIIKVTPLQSTIETNLNVILALDNSASMQESRKELLQSVNLLLTTLRGKSRISLIVFDERSEITSEKRGRIDNEVVNVKFYPFTENLDLVMKSVTGNYESGNMSGRTYLYDMMLIALQQTQQLPPNLLRIIILLSDGQDIGSNFGFDKVLAVARKAGITIYCIDYSRLSEVNDILRKLSATAPQGKVFRADKATDLMPVFDALSKEIITEFQVTYQFPQPPSGDIQFAGDSLTITARGLVDEFPMLNYIFFDSNAVEIDSQYHRFTRPEETTNFDETAIQKSLDKYYHILNIIGSRARKDTSAQLTITGCNMDVGAEKGNITLSRQRAENVAQYLYEIWGVGGHRIKINARTLPEKKSSARTPEGLAENRRVEIASDHYFIMRPIRSEITELLFKPEIGYFTTQIQAPEGLKKWEFSIYNENAALARMSFDEPKSPITWNWIDDRGEKIHDLSELNYQIKITDDDGRIFVSPKRTLPISKLRESRSLVETTQDSSFEKFSLVLFDFNSSELSENNQYLMQRVLSRYMEHPDAMMKVYGYSDTIGDEEYNLKLSTQRAKIVYDILGRMGISVEKSSFQGYGEINPIFSNATPEGRFLNRTVQIYISYPKTQEE